MSDDFGLDGVNGEGGSHSHEIYKPFIEVTESQLQIIRTIFAERERQEKLRDEGRFPFTAANTGLKHAERLPMLTEELGEIARQIQQQPDSGLMPVTHAGTFDAHKAGSVWEHDSDAGTIGGLEKELVQLCAIGVAWLEAISSQRAAAASPKSQSSRPSFETGPPPAGGFGSAR